MELKLAAILAAEVVELTRLLREREAATLAALQAHHHALIDRAIAMHRGRIVELRLDRTLVAFEVVVDAMACALEIQRGMARRGAGLPSEQRILLQVGLDYRDIVADKGDLSGPGVEVARYLSNLAEPGGLVISDQVFIAVRKRVEVGFKGRGVHRIAGLENPIRAIGVIDDQGAGPRGWWPWRRAP